MKLSRRSFLFGLIGLAGAATTRTNSLTSWDLKVRQHSFPIPMLPKAFENYRIGFVSDIHLGIYVTPEWVDHALNPLVEAKVDMLLIGGDHIDVPKNPAAHLRNTRSKKLPLSSRQRAFGALLTEQFASLIPTSSFPDGVMAVPGNHDNWNSSYAAKSIFEQLGIRYLVNESITLERDKQYLEIVGVDDYWTGIPTLPQPAIAGKNPARVLLAHNPDYISQILKNTDYHFSLGLAGHTHGGQICFPGGIPIITNVQDTRFVAGESTIKNSSILVSCGVGVVEVPWRVNCPPEVHIISLNAA